MAVLLLDGRDDPHMPHDPEFSWKVGRVVDSSEPMLGTWTLDQEHLDLLWVDARGQERPMEEDSLHIVRDQRVYFASGEAANAFPADAEEAEDFSWIPSISQIHPGLSIDPDLLKPRVTNPNLVARLALTEGRIKVSSFVDDPGAPGGIAAYEFRNGQGRLGHPQALAEGVTAEVAIPEGAHLKVRLRKLADPGAGERWVILTPRNRGEDIELELANRPTGRVGIAHFKMFYRLMKGSGSGGPLPQISHTNRLVSRGKWPSPSFRVPDNTMLSIAVPDACPFVQGP
jgi:hypothetical protein